MRHFNNTINKSMSDIFNLKGESTDEINDVIIPVVLVQTTLDFIRPSLRTVSGSSNVTTTATDKDTFISNINFSMVKDVACDVATGGIYVNAFVNGTQISIASIPVITLTAQQHNIDINFNRPLKIDRGTVISTTGTYAAGSMSRQVTLYGFTVETVKNT